MEDPATQQRCEPGAAPDFDIEDYITSNPDGDGNPLDLFVALQHPHSSTTTQTNIEATVPSQNVLNSQNSIEFVSQRQPQTVLVAEMLKGRLEQQMKLQQLQQLQNHILQQQIELISNQSSMNDQQKEIIFNGLLTPGPSTELRAMAPSDLVSPMMLQQDMFYNNNSTVSAVVNQFPSHQRATSMSAPASLAFHTSPPFPLPAEPGDDLEPLTSPWLLPLPAQQNKRQCPEDYSENSQPRPTRLKRAASMGGDDPDGTRQQQPQTVHFLDLRPETEASISPQSSSTSTSPLTAVLSGLKSGNAAPLTHDTPSPMDLPMPPSAPPMAGSRITISPTSTSVSPDLAPVTPASIMNLGKLPTGLSPSHLNAGEGASTRPKKGTKPKNVTRPKGTVANGNPSRGRRDSVTKPGISPSLKPILPGVSAPSTSSLTMLPSNSQPTTSFASTSVAGPRKTSHKAAEQKRRDSLKTSFDELRILLPPVPLPDEAGDDPPLPGSMPPRGPPKGDADGPNRAVSKLALLRCGNNYIRELKAKVGRRDVEIELLRAELRGLRAKTGDPGGVDLDRDIDEGEYSLEPIGEFGEDMDEEGE